MAEENKSAAWEELIGLFDNETSGQQVYPSDTTDNTDNTDNTEVGIYEQTPETADAARKTGLPEASFEETVEEYNLARIKPTYNGKKTSIINGVFVVRLLLLVACASMFMYCVFSIADRVIADMKSKSLMDNLIETTERKSVVSRVAKVSGTPSTLTLYDALGVTEYENDYKNIEVDATGKYDNIRYTIMDLKNKNKEIYGWIRCKGGMANINYPIVKSTDNSFYLDKNIYKSTSPSGSIFTDFRNSFTHSNNYNTIFYGHNMSSGDMFGAVSVWYNSPTRNTMAEQITIEVITPDAVYIYEIFAAYRSVGADFTTVSFRNNSNYLSFLQKIANKSVLKRGMPYDVNTRIITLSTCTNVKSNPDERYVVHGILTKIIKYS